MRCCLLFKYSGFSLGEINWLGFCLSMLLCKYKPTYSKCKLTKKLHILSPMATLPESPRYRPNLPLSGTSHQLKSSRQNQKILIKFIFLTYFGHFLYLWIIFFYIWGIFKIWSQDLYFEHFFLGSNIGDLPDFYFYFWLASLVLCLGFKQACTSFWLSGKVQRNTM